MLMFFAATGIVLNHPNWFLNDSHRPIAYEEGVFQPESLVALTTQSDEAVARLIRKKFPIYGRLDKVDRFEDEWLIRFKGAKGESFVTVDLGTGGITVENERADFLAIMKDLHTGEHTGIAWRLVIDVSAGLILLLSTVGFFLFFTMRFRLGKSLAMCGSSLAVIGLTYFYAVS